jgi:hypothetical protein
MRDTVLRALERCSSCALDTDEERGVVADAVLAALRAAPDAVLIRRLFENAATPGTRIAVVASDGKRLSAAIESAVKLAGGA